MARKKLESLVDNLGVDNAPTPEDNNVTESPTEEAPTVPTAEASTATDGEELPEAPTVPTARKRGRPRIYNKAGGYRATSLIVNVEQEAKLNRIAELTGRSSKEIHELASAMFIKAYEKKYGKVVVDSTMANISLEDLI